MAVSTRTQGFVSHFVECCKYKIRTGTPVVTPHPRITKLSEEDYEDDDEGDDEDDGNNWEGFDYSKGGNCSWIYSNYGEQLECPNGQVATGICASGENADRNSNYNGILCCDL